MFYLTSQTRNITCFIRNTELKANQTGLFCSALVNSLSRKISYKSFPRTKCIQGTIKRSFSGGWLQRIQSMPNIRDRGVCWFEEEFYWTNKRIHSMTGIHGNVANFRKFSTSGHSEKKSEIFGEWRENKILTVPNILCFGRILASPVLGYLVLSEQYLAALGLFVVAGFTDMLDGLIARRFPSQMSYLGSVLDPIADKILVGVLTISLSLAHLIPVPLAVIILGRDIALIVASFIVRFISLPPPGGAGNVFLQRIQWVDGSYLKSGNMAARNFCLGSSKTFSRYFDFQLPTVQVTPSMIGKINTALQLALISLSLAAPIIDITEHSGLVALQYTVGITTIASGLDYFITRRGFSILGKDE